MAPIALSTALLSSAAFSSRLVKPPCSTMMAFNHYESANLVVEYHHGRRTAWWVPDTLILPPTNSTRHFSASLLSCSLGTLDGITSGKKLRMH